MTYLGFFVGVIVLAVGCQVEQGGLGTSADPPAGGSSSTGEAGGTASSGTGADTSGGDTTAGSGTAGSSTGPLEGTTAASTGPAPESSSGSEESGEPPPVGAPYGPCTPALTCDGFDVACYENSGLTMCLPPCDGSNPSCPPPPPDNTSLVECVQVPATPHCMLNCAAEGTASCPAGTTCVDLGGIFRCLWP